MANSLVGVSTITLVTDFCCGRYNKRSKTGNMKATVLPVPVAEHAHRSRPASARGMHVLCIRVGSAKPHAVMA
ncbi:hypothetical protein QQG55_23365 [Brugia pahangi]